MVDWGGFNFSAFDIWAKLHGGLVQKFTPFDPTLFLPPITEAQKTTLTGTETEEDFAAQIIGKDIPIFVGGQALIGCRIAEGPFINTVAAEGFVDMIVTAAVTATPTATRELQSIRLNGTESFTSVDGGVTWTPVGAVFAGVEINVLYGTETQTPLASSIARYGARAVPYRSHICVELKNIPLSVFANEIPFVSVHVWEADSILRRDALLKLAEYARYDTSECEFQVSGEDTFWIVHKQSTFIGYLQELQRTVGRNWNINPADKLYVYENSATVTPITLDRSDIVADSIRFQQIDPLAIPAQRAMEFIDTGRDNAINSVKATRARFPVPLTSSVESESLGIPIGMGAAEAKTIVNKSLLIDDIGRDRFMCRVLPHMRGLQPGDIIAPDVDDDIVFPTARIISVARNASDWTSDIVAERIELVLLPTGPSITSNGGGATASITVNEEQTAVTTVTADQAGTFSIAGGDDASFFTINSSTGVLTFLSAPDYEDPQDTDSNNTYEVIVQVLADGLFGSQVITVTVADIADGINYTATYLSQGIY